MGEFVEPKDVFLAFKVEPKDVFLAFTVDQGGNVVNACEGLGVEVTQVQLPPRQLRGHVESGHCGLCGALQEQSDGRAHEEAGMCRCLEPLRRQQRQAEGAPKAPHEYLHNSNFELQITSSRFA